MQFDSRCGEASDSDEISRCFMRGLVLKLFNRIFVALGGAAVFASITGFFQDNGSAILGLLIAMLLIGGCTAEFTLVITGEGFGTVTSLDVDDTEGNKKICTIKNSVASGSCEILINEMTTLTAIPASGYLFVQWQNCPAATGNICEVHNSDTGLDDSITIKAIFDD